MEELFVLSDEPAIYKRIVDQRILPGHCLGAPLAIALVTQRGAIG
jgi:hypothetical protein